MVANTRKTQGTDSLRTLSNPTRMRVDCGSDGLPQVVYAGKTARKRRVLSIQDRWRIDDEWWRENPVSRSYFQILLEDGRNITVFRDDVDLNWYYQRY